MKYGSLVILLLFSITAFGSNGWSLRSSDGDVKVFSQNGLYVALEDNSIANEADYKKMLQSKDFKAKGHTLSLIGVSDWNVKSDGWNKIGSKKYFRFSGSYVDNSGDQTFFKEYHYVKGNKVRTYLFTSLDEAKLKNTTMTKFIEDKSKEGN